MPQVAIASSERAICEQLAEFVSREYGDLTDEGKFVFLLMLIKSIGPEVTRITKKFKEENA